MTHSIAHEEPMFGSCTFSMVGLRYTYGCATASAPYVCNLYAQNQWVMLHSWVSNLKCSLCWLALPSESLGYRTHMAIKTLVQSMFVKSAFGITCLVSSYQCYLKCSLYLLVVHLQNHCVTLHLWVSNLRRSICLSALPTE